MSSENSNINLNKLKYLKYKNKYLSLQKMTGGTESEYKKKLNEIKEEIDDIDKQKKECMIKLEEFKKKEKEDLEDCKTKMKNASNTEAETTAVQKGVKLATTQVKSLAQVRAQAPATAQVLGQLQNDIMEKFRARAP